MEIKDIAERRECFKQSAKQTVPVMGLASNSRITKASSGDGDHTGPFFCQNDACKWSCKGDCVQKEKG